VPLVMIWISGMPPLFTASRHTDTRVSWETRGWKSAIDGYFHSVIAWIILIVKTSSHYRTQLLVDILWKCYMFLVKYSIMRLHTDLNWGTNATCITTLRSVFSFPVDLTSQNLYCSKTVKRMLANSRRNNIKTKNFYVISLQF